MARLLSFSLIPALLIAVVGCCPCPKQEKPPILPPPLSLQQQVTEFNARAHVITNVAARGNVKITWIDQGKSRSESAEAVLRIRQRFGVDASKNFGGDLALFGRAVLQPVFEVGKNPVDTWFLVRLDTKTAWTAKTAELASSDRVGPSRADLMLDLLAITELPAPASAPGSGEPVRERFVIQRYPENSSQVELLVFGVTNNNYIGSGTIKVAPSGVRLERCITIDRVTNLPTRVTTYDAGGLPLIVANLSDYREAPLRDGDKYRTDALPPKLPYHITIQYVRDGAQVELKFDDMSVPVSILDKVFQTPNFVDEGLKVKPINE